MSMSGAEYLASIYGTEKDKVNCSFYIKTGACRHSERCSRKHNKPQYSQTVVLLNMYVSPQNSAKSADGSHMANLTDTECQDHFEYFFEDVFFECEEKYGEIEEMCICDNHLRDHLRGNVYIKFRREEDAGKAVEDLNNRWYMFRPIYGELCPVTDFREACCRQFEMGQCGKGGFCNFWHVKPISPTLRDLLAKSSRRDKRGAPPRPGRFGRSRSRSRGRSKSSRKRSRSRDRDRRDRRGRY
ncbi:unnamed protein product [Meganyctiphanes norvegica]|uniref:Splicing factor U2af 38 kDa subunit n=1 Tax=Meganyctiphanes norvegica TaxID=48144 RepID=A0AAV2RYJ0_MEGNR